MPLTKIQSRGTENVGQGSFNVIVNGAMNVAQYASSASGLGASVGIFTCDRWRHVFNTSGRVSSAQDDSDTPDTDGFSNALKISTTTADTSIASGEYFFIQQKIEGHNLQQFAKGTSNAKSFGVSFYVKGNASATYVCELYDADNSRQVSKAFSVTTSWTRVELIFPADTTGAFDDDKNASFNFTIWLHAGSDYTSGTLNQTWGAVTNANRAVGITSILDSTSRTFSLTGVQLEVGSQASDFQHEEIGTSLMRCQRYFIDCGTMLIQGYGYGTGSDGLSAPMMFPTTMRDTPTMTESNSADGGSSTGLVINNISTRGCSPEGFNNGSGQSIYYTMNLTADAEF